MAMSYREQMAEMPDDAPMLTPEEDRALSLELDRENAEANPPEPWETTMEQEAETVASHTPGPWHIENDDEICTDASGACVAMVNCCGFGEHISEETHAANALLIAASPDLMQALEEFVVEAEHWGITERNSAALVFALDAIAKAKGEPSPVRPQSVAERGVW